MLPPKQLMDKVLTLKQKVVFLLSLIFLTKMHLRQGPVKDTRVIKVRFGFVGSGCGCGSVGRAVASNTRDLQFKS